MTGPAGTPTDQGASDATTDSGDALIRASLDGVITGWSREAEMVFGYSRSEMIGQSLDRLSLSMAPIADDLGTVAGVPSLVHHVRIEPDIRETQRTLAESEARFRGAFETAAHGMALVSIEGKFIKVNRSLCNMLGYAEAELLQTQFQHITHPDDLQADLGYVESLLKGEISHYDMEKRYFHKNAQVIWILLSVSLVRGESGRPIHFVSQIQDITQRRLAEFRLRRLNRLHTVLSKVGEAIVRTRERQPLYEAVCRIIVDHGLLRLVFVAAADTEDGVVEPVAQYGAELGTPPRHWMRLDLGGDPESLDTVATALRTGRPDVCNDIATTARVDAWREAALSRGLLSNASFPLKLQGVAIAALVLWAGETDYFQEDEIALMAAVADSLSFALEALEKEQRRQRAETLSAQLAVIVESSDAAIIGKTLDGVVTSWNRGAETIFGYSAEEMVGTSILRLVPADRTAEEDQIQEAIRRGDSVRSLETLRRARNGRLINLSITVSPIRNDAGAIIGASKVAHDISQLKVSEARFRRLTNSNVESVYFWNTRGQITGGNDAFLRLTGYSRDDLNSGRMNWVAMTPPEYAAADQRALAEIVEHGHCATYEKEFIRKDGGRTSILIGAAVFEDNPSEGVCFVLDLTERNQLEQQLRQSQKMELLGQLTGGIAHDFNNLLAIIQLNLGLIRDRLRDDPDLQDMAGMALQATRRGANLTQQLLAFSRRQPLQPKTVNIEYLLAGMASLLGRTLGETIRLTTKIPAGLWTTAIDPHKLENALLNLAVNALHAMPGGGRLIIEASNKVLDAAYAAAHPDATAGDYVLVSVTDTGAGMAPEVLEHSLEPFFTTKPVGRGSGLGLSMVHGFVRQSGGHLKIYSEPGRGTTVNLFLPRGSGPAAPERAVRHRDAPSAVAGERVLVVEDDPSLRGLTLRILEGLGYRTLQAGDGPAACAILDGGERVDLLLTDVVLPKGMNGPELARRTRARRPGVKVLYMSGYPRDAVFGDGPPEAQARLLSKPFSKEELAQTVRRALDEDDPTEPPAARPAEPATGPSASPFDTA